MNVPNITDWLQAIGAIATAILSFLLIAQIYLARKQLLLGIQWNKLSATFTYFPSDIFIARLRLVAEMLSNLGVDLYHKKDALDDQTVNAILSDTNKFKDVMAWLNLLEDYATAVSVGVLDLDCSFELLADVIIRNFHVFKPIIEKRRSELNSLRIWIELEKLALEWSTRRQREIEELERRLEQVREKYRREQDELLKNRGTKKKF